MHTRDAATATLTSAVLGYAVDRMMMDPPPLDHPRSPEELAATGPTITPGGMGGERALRHFTDVLAPACLSVDHPRYLAFVPTAPTEASVLFDLVVGASSIYGGSWMEGAGAVAAENETLGWLAGLAGLPASAGGVFVAGGTAGNLSALIAARWSWRARDARPGATARDAVRGAIVASRSAHSSVGQAASVLDADVFWADADERGRLGGAAVATLLDKLAPGDLDRVFAVVATAGSTNAGVVDDLAGVADAAAAHDIWFHVDAAYGGAALLVPEVRGLFAGIERADSLIVDPHKWLFAPFDACALLYRTPAIAKQAHTQHASYLDVLHDNDDWNPSDYAHHLTRRARGLPLWFSLATHGTDAYRDAVRTTLDVAHRGADLIRSTPYLELALDPELSVVVFRRRGWSADDYRRWSRHELDIGEAFVVPTVWAGDVALRLCIVNPRTTLDDIRLIVNSLR